MVWAVVVVALVSNLTLEFKTQTKDALLPWFLHSRKHSVLLEENQEDEDQDVEQEERNSIS